MKNVVHVMLDLETMDNTPTSAIIAIGAVAFHSHPEVDPETGGTLEVVSKFYTEVSLADCVKNGLTMSPGTVIWWLKQSDEARRAFTENNKAPTLLDALERFAAWIRVERSDDGMVWGNGSDFDNAIMRNAYNKLGYETPWPYWVNGCYRTIKNLNKDVKFNRVGVYHNALHDAESQARHLIDIFRSQAYAAKVHGGE